MDEGGEGRRRAPGKSVVHEAFRRGWPAVSSLVPQRVKQEVERYLSCGDVRCGFVEVSCADCHESRLVAFSCKGRGWCPSCTTRRALETGAHLEAVLPRVAHRQWTLSLPRSVRFQVVRQPALLKRLEVRLVKAVWRQQPTPRRGPPSRRPPVSACAPAPPSPRRQLQRGAEVTSPPRRRTRRWPARASAWRRPSFATGCSPAPWWPW